MKAHEIPLVFEITRSHNQSSFKILSYFNKYKIIFVKKHDFV